MIKNTRIGVLISGGGTNMQAIVRACKAGQIDGKVVFVGSDNPSAKGLKYADIKGKQYFVVDYKKIITKLNEQGEKFSLDLTPKDVNLLEVFHKSRSIIPKKIDNTDAAFFWLLKRVMAERELLKAMEKFSFDLLVLAGFMRNLSSYFIDRVNSDSENPRIMNIHPALLPAFSGTDGYGDTYRYGCKVGGCTVHFVDYGEDTGPIIGQRAFPINEEDDIDAVIERGLQLEYQLYPECIQLFAEGRLSLETVKQSDGSVRKVVKTL